MYQESEKWIECKKFLKEYLKTYPNQRAADLYQAYVDYYIGKNGVPPDTNKHNFSIWLKLQNDRPNGVLKRVSHGVYTLRTAPEEFGVALPKTGIRFRDDLHNDPLIEHCIIPGDKTELNNIARDTLELEVRISDALHSLQQTCDVSPEEKAELEVLQEATRKRLRGVSAGISKLIFLYESHSMENVTSQNTSGQLHYREPDLKSRSTTVMIQKRANEKRASLIEEQRAFTGQSVEDEREEPEISDMDRLHKDEPVMTF